MTITVRILQNYRLHRYNYKSFAKHVRTTYIFHCVLCLWVRRFACTRKFSWLENLLTNFKRIKTHLVHEILALGVKRQLPIENRNEEEIYTF